MNLSALKFKNDKTKRDNYMSLADIMQDATTESLLVLAPTLKKLSDQMLIMGEIEKRNEVSDELYFETLEKCNGI